MQMTSDIPGIFLLILAAFTLASTFLSTWSILNAVRLRSVRLSWNAGKLKGYPLFSTLFMATSLILCGVVWYHSLSSYYLVTACYVWISINWFIASYLASKHYITDHGIVKNINDPSQTVAWYQVTDFLDRPSGKGDGQEYVFIYQTCNREETLCNSCVRLELTIPLCKTEDFKKVVNYKLGKTISPEMVALKDAGAMN